MKTKIRKEVLESRKKLSPAAILARSRSIARRLFGLPEFKSASTVMFYVSQGSEVHTHRMIRDALHGGKRVVVPLISGQDKRLLPVVIRDFDRELSPGSRGILEPAPGKGLKIPPTDIDLVILPGVAFDLKGNRVGRGQAYYDSFLKELRPRIAKIALAFETQVVKEVPAASHDIPVTHLITEKRVVRCVGGEGPGGRQLTASPSRADSGREEEIIKP